MIENCIIFGAGNQAKLIVEIINLQNESNKQLNLNQVRVIGFLDDNPKLINKEIHGLPVISKINDLNINLINKYNIKFFGVGIGNSSSGKDYSNLIIRNKFFKFGKSFGLTCVNAIHPGAIISSNVNMGEGNVIFPLVVINNNSILGDNNVIYSGSIIEHDCKIKNNNYLSPGVILAGNVTINNNCFLGIGSKIIPNVILNDETTVGAGAVVIKDSLYKSTVVGIPAREKNI